MSIQLTVGTPDANGNGANSVGRVLYKVIGGDPATPANEADVQVGASLTDVRHEATLEDYTGELSVQQTVQLTDRQNGPGQDEPATVAPFEFKFAVPRAATASTTEGGRCTLSSSFNALVPGSVLEQKRAIWELGNGPSLRRRPRRPGLYELGQHALRAAGRLHPLTLPGSS
jgi:hypothetical protein